ncbi:hypothetical protein Hypma_006361 [Hypsizygus marmoreus]|uniref:Protein kinase domain-containing protein n=1 Tax=Hypsizygus marmoreus TaxID=39966 RepID=A0A369JX70_HYPMA|nr:hypothetical protein Hypma_006361 [Hypsizygus marmoreus]
MDVFLPASVGDTPIKTVVSSALRREMLRANDDSHAVEKDVKGHLYSADTSSFIRRIFPVPDETVDIVFRALVDSSVYHNSRWEGLPESTKDLESKHYIPLSRLCNAIKAALPQSAPPDDPSNAQTSPPTRPNTPDAGSTQEPMTDDAPINGTWIDRHSKAPDSLDVDRSKIRPDLIFTRAEEEMEALDEKIIQLIANSDSATNDPKPNAKEKPVLTPGEQLMKMKQVWWQHIHTVIEIKRFDHSVTRAFRQLLMYMRRMLCEQVDRRFVLGLLLCFDRLTVCLCDRSGVLFTQTSFSIHQDPRSFIRVIAGFSVLKPHQLGWDPGMKVYIPESGRIVPSYALRPDESSNQPYRTHWLIDFPLKDGTVEKVVTVRGISLARAEVMCGRATLVWEAVKYSELPSPQTLYVLKRYWRPTEPVGHATADASTSPIESNPGPVQDNNSAPQDRTAQDTGAIDDTNPFNDGIAPERLVPEEEFYHLLNVQDERLELSGDITIDGVVDSTSSTIRQGLMVSLADWNQVDARPARSGQKRVRLETDPDGENTLHTNIIPYSEGIQLGSLSFETIPRIHTQLLMKDPGPCVKHFSSLRELLTVTEDCVHDHKKFHAKKVLHRDVSPGNMIIIPQDSGWTEPGKGRLIDFDHAKQTTKEEMTALIKDNPTPQLWSDFIFQNVLLVKPQLAGRVGIDVIAAAIHALGIESNMVSSYIMDTITVREQYFGLKPREDGEVYNRADLGWDKKDKIMADFNNRQARLGFRSGTLPYMSSEVLTKKVYNKGEWRQESFFHDAVHDADSFGWVLIHICLTRKGPGMNMYRNELLPDSLDMSPEAVALRAIVFKLFDAGEDIVSKRVELLDKPSKMDKEIIPRFHAYFTPLGPMILRWWHTLVLAYTFRAFEYFHAQDFLIEILRRTKEEYEDDPAFKGSDGTDATKNEIQRRIDHYGRALTAFKRPTDKLGEGSVIITPERAVKSTPALGPVPGSPTRPAQRNNSKRPRVETSAAPGNQNLNIDNPNPI